MTNHRMTLAEGRMLFKWHVVRNGLQTAQFTAKEITSAAKDWQYQTHLDRSSGQALRWIRYHRARNEPWLPKPLPRRK